MTKPHHHVVCAIIVNAANQVLVAQRSAHQYYAGYWEFPGGKCEPGETLHQALTRELHEELAIDVEDAVPWMVIEHEYPPYVITLHIWQVMRYRGEPVGHEGQQVAWMDREQLLTLKFPEANDPIVDALQTD